MSHFRRLLNLPTFFMHIVSGSIDTFTKQLLFKIVCNYLKNCTKENKILNNYTRENKYGFFQFIYVFK